MKLHDIAERYACRIGDPKLSAMFRQCFLSTADTTAQMEENGSCFVITGDIPAMWLRDSSAQVNHYVPFVKESSEAFNMVSGLIRRQTQCILSDAYANAFNREPNGEGHQNDRTAQSLDVFERKYEVDSLCYPIRLAYRFWKAADTTIHFTKDFSKALYRIIDLWTLEQHHENSPYYFERFNCPSSDTLPNGGKGAPVAYTGMTWSGFRPSDDACKYGYLIPANMFASVVLGYVEEIAKIVYQDEELKSRAGTLKAAIDSGIAKEAIVEFDSRKIYAYETDGCGHYNLMDDANVPSLLSLPYLGYCDQKDAMYMSTRAFVLSKENPYYYCGTVAKGVGSPHTPDNHIWPIALCMQALTSTDNAEVKEIIRVLKRTDNNTGFMHESFHANDPSTFTREWFSWANTLFAELLIQCLDERGMTL